VKRQVYPQKSLLLLLPPLLSIDPNHCCY